jgi:hypothetical protein
MQIVETPLKSADNDELGALKEQIMPPARSTGRKVLDAVMLAPSTAQP